LLKHDHVSKEDLHAAIANKDNPTTKIRVVDVVIHKLRKKLVPYGIEITNLHSFGFNISESARDKIRKILAGYGGDIVLAATSRGEEAHE
jgi:hypothetical protein